MLCENCKKNIATIHIKQISGGEKAPEHHFCQECYQKLKKEGRLFRGTSDSPVDPFSFDNLEDVLREIPNPFKNFEEETDGVEEGNRTRFEEMFRRASEEMRKNPDRKPKGYIPRKNRENASLLNRLTINLTNQAKAGKIDPVIGRDEEIDETIEILNRRRKNNPVLIGEAGVGKTAVVEGLALRIVEGNVPQKLKKKQILRLDVSSLTGGASFVGALEERLNALLKEIAETEDVILFIDEVHEIVGAGSAGKSGMDVSNIMKPALARGEVNLIGATTLDEYRIIEKDKALERRFQPVRIEEPTVEETIEILKGLKNRNEEYHHVSYTDDAIIAAVTLSSRYIQDRFLPDKAIDLMDQAGSKKNLTLAYIDTDELQERIDKREAKKQKALEKEDFETAANLRDQIKKMEELKATAIDPSESAVVTKEDIAAIVEKKTGIPVGELEEKESAQLIDLEKNIGSHVIGQEKAVEKVAKSIRRRRVGFGGNDKPIGSFLFVGPTGVGKTELAKQLALELFGSKELMIRLDMSEYMEKHNVSKIIGSPPGYIGFGEGGQLTEKVRRNPNSVILLDEIEKAHPDVLHIFLQILDDGRLTDAQGRLVSFKDVIIIMTTNAGVGIVEKSVGFGAAREDAVSSVLPQMKNFFSPEFINRIDGVVEFEALSKSDLEIIVQLMIDELSEQLKEKELTIHVQPSAKRKIVELSYDPAMGARPLKRAIQDEIVDKVVEEYLRNPQLKKFVVKTSKNSDTLTVKGE
ncbi:MAG: ATP-dependent Clp protease ATP-binding subunit [Streptococcaceae bacterium]|nr:ATP-dependent Clp protease ATP-binding subunit [Streptococcaceae bacterium]